MQPQRKRRIQEVYPQRKRDLRLRFGEFISATSEEGENSGSVPSEEEGLTIPSKGHMNHPVVWGKF